MASTRDIPACPREFDGSLSELYERHILPTLPPVDSVEKIHLEIVLHCQQERPLFVVRQVSPLVRGRVYETADGDLLKPSDNSPAWWAHFAAFNDLSIGALSSVPTHMFEMSARVRTSISTAGWHVAHIYNAKDGNTTWQGWDRTELIRRFVRNLHPCNCFYVPKAGWHRFGGDPTVIAFFAHAYAERYKTIWSDFLGLAGASPTEVQDWTSVRYSTPRPPPRTPAEPGQGTTSYRFHRLCFKADVIEPLSVDEAFEVITPAGTFRMTKGEFYAAFPRVPLTKSYKEGRAYHFPKVPKAALRFKVPDADNEIL